jgi:hypothetical protein
MKQLVGLCVAVCLLCIAVSANGEESIHGVYCDVEQPVRSMTFDSVRRIKANFGLSYFSGREPWTLIFPHRLKVVPGEVGLYSARGFVETDWNIENREPHTCRYPITITVDSYAQANWLDITITAPRLMRVGCTHTGEEYHLYTMVRALECAN